MKQVIYKGEVQGTYSLLCNGALWQVPMNMSTEKAQKQIARIERNAKIKEWILAHDEVTTFTIVLVALVIMGLVVA